MFGIDGRFSKGPKLEQFWVENRLGGGLSHNTVYDFPVVLDKDLTLFTATADEAGVVQTSSPDYSTHGRAWVVKVRFSRANKSDINAK
jgi:hypothetical protein